MDKNLPATTPDHQKIQAIEDYLKGIHPQPKIFEDAMQQDRELAAEMELQRQIAQAFADPNKNKLRDALADLQVEAMLDNQIAEAFADPQKNELREVLTTVTAEVALDQQLEQAFGDPQKNQLREVLAGLNQEFAMQVSHKSMFVSHLQTWSKQYMAAAAMLLVALAAVFLMEPKNPNVPQVAQNQPTTQPDNAATRSETPAPPKADEQLANNSPKPKTEQPSPAPKPNEGIAHSEPKVKVENDYLSSEITRGSDGAAKIELVADLILKDGYEELEEVQVRLVPRSKNEPTISVQVPLRTENAVGYVKNTPPSKVLEVETSVPLEAGEYDVQVILPDGEVIFTGKTLVRNVY